MDELIYAGIAVVGAVLLAVWLAKALGSINEVGGEDARW